MNESTAHETAAGPARWQQWLQLGAFSGARAGDTSAGAHAWLRATGGAVALLLSLQLLTGTLLAFYFTPSVQSAHTTVTYVEKIVAAGFWVRSLHHYGSQLVLVVLLLHLAQQIVTRAYLNSRVAWFTTILLLGLALAAGTTGYSLPWDERAYFATKITEGLAGGLPVIGPTARAWVLGGTEISPITLTRFFAAHVLLLPFLFILVTVARWLLFREPQQSSTQSSTARGIDSAQFARNLIVGSLVLLGLAIFCAKYPAPLGPAAGTAPSGYLPRPGPQFLWLFQTLKYLPGGIASLVATALPGVILGLFSALPFLRWASLGKLSAPLIHRIAVVALFATVGYVSLMTVLAKHADASDPRVKAGLEKQEVDEARARATPFQPVGGAQPDNNVVANHPPASVTPASYKRSCAGCHGSSGQGVAPFPKLTGLAGQRRRTLEDIVALLNDPTAYGLDPPMKSFKTKLTDEEKLEIARYVLTLK